MRDFFNLLTTSFTNWSKDGAPRLGAALAFYTFFSISPMLLIMIAVAGFVFGREAVQGELINQLTSLMGKEAARLLNDTLIATSGREENVLASLIALVITIIGATGFFAQLQDALDSIWHVKRISNSGWLYTIWRYWWSFSMIVGCGFILMVSLLISAALAAVSTFASNYVANTGIVLEGLHLLVSLAVTTGLFTLIFKLIPHIDLPWPIALRGGILTALLFGVGKLVLGIYLGRAAVSSAYGAAGALVIFLLWTYYSAQILLFGAEFTKTLAQLRKKTVNPAVDFALEKVA